MNDFKELENKSIALVIWNLEKDDDVHVYVGRIINNGVDYIFKNEEQNWTVTIQPEKLNDIQKVSEDLKETLLNADYFVNMTVKGMDENDNGEFVPTGIKWH